MNKIRVFGNISDTFLMVLDKHVGSLVIREALVEPDGLIARVEITVCDEAKCTVVKTTLPQTKSVEQYSVMVENYVKENMDTIKRMLLNERFLSLHGFAVL